MCEQQLGVADSYTVRITATKKAPALSQMEWKLARGKWRPRLQAFVEALPADAVVESSTAAFAHVSESAESEAALKSAVNALTNLKVRVNVHWAAGFAGLH